MGTEGFCYDCGLGSRVLAEGWGALGKHVSHFSKTKDLVCLRIILSGLGRFLDDVRWDLFQWRSHHGESDRATTAEAVHSFSFSYTECGKVGMKSGGDSGSNKGISGNSTVLICRSEKVAVTLLHRWKYRERLATGHKWSSWHFFIAKVL